MKLPTPKKEVSSNQDLLFKTVLTSWMASVTLLLQNYTQLTNLVNNYYLEMPFLIDHSTGIGQCPIRELQELISLFERELEALLADITNTTYQGQAAHPEGYKKLVDHTQRLDQLNRQAQIRLQVANQPAS